MTKTRGDDGVARDTIYAHDRAGRVTSMETPAGGVVAYSWDLSGVLVEVGLDDGWARRFSHDVADRVTGIEARPAGGNAFTPMASYGYDADGLLGSETLTLAGASRTWDRSNEAGVVESYTQTVPSPGGSESVVTDLVWRPDGRLASETVNGESTAFGYDDAGQLTSADGAVDRSWEWGTRGNLLNSTVDAVVTTYVTNPNGSIAAASSGDRVTDYTYDDAGRRTRARTTVASTVTGTTDTGFDAAGRLASIGLSDVAVPLLETRVFDGQDRVTTSSVTTAGATVNEDRIWYAATGGPAQVIASSTDAGLSWSHTSFGPAGLIGEESPTTAAIFETDIRGSVIQTNPANPNTIQAPPSWAPWGTPTQPTTTSPTRGYRGEHTTAGLIHLRARDYDPTTSQFLTQDPLDGVDGTPTVTNPYHYTDNDPLNKTDPLGLRASECTFSLGSHTYDDASSPSIFQSIWPALMMDMGCDDSASVAWDQFGRAIRNWRSSIRGSNLGCTSSIVLDVFTGNFRHCAVQKATQQVLPFLLESRPGGELDLKPTLIELLRSPSGPYQQNLLMDLGDRSYAYYYDVIGNAVWGAAVQIEFHLHGSAQATLSRNCPQALCGEWEPGDDISIRAGARAAERHGSSVTLNIILAEIRRSNDEYLRLRSGILSIADAPYNKLVPWPRVPRS
ncbi:MAG: RHS repeat-associated core domain-containing protein [Acidimicrobiales bacterium]|nr:RHS repeat-associated core domain-containing protein [Acidimicrobiales bacterium]